MTGELADRPTVEEMEGQMNKLNSYVTVKAFEQMKGIVSNKCEWIQYDELRLRVEGLDYKIKEHAV